MWRCTQTYTRRASARTMVWAIAALVSLMLAWLMPTPAHAAGVADLMPNIHLNEHNLSDNVRKFCACAVASAAMIIDYYQLDYHLPVTTQPATIDDVAPYLPVYVSKAGMCTGSNPYEVPSGVVKAEAAIHPTLPLIATIQRTNSTDWFPTLRAYLDNGLPVIVFIPNGTNLHGTDPYNYGHTIVVSGYTADGSIIYHDPWDGTIMSNAAFADAWKTPYPPDDPGSTFYYVQVLPSGVASPWPLSTSTPVVPSTPPTAVSPTTPPTIAPTAIPTLANPSIEPGGVWISPQDGETITDGLIHFAAHAYPTSPSDPPIDHVNFTLNTDGNWQIVCTVSAQQASGDVYVCDVQTADLAGTVQVSFDVYDQAGSANLAPNGVHTLTFAAPTATPVSDTGGLYVRTLTGSSTSYLVIHLYPDCYAGGGYIGHCSFNLGNSSGHAINFTINIQYPLYLFENPPSYLDPGEEDEFSTDVAVPNWQDLCDNGQVYTAAFIGDDGSRATVEVDCPSV